MKIKYITIFLLIILFSCTNNDENENINCPKQFSIPNEPNITKINIYRENELSKTYFIDEQNRINEIKIYAATFNMFTSLGKKYKYVYNSCGALSKIIFSYIDTAQYGDDIYVDKEFIYDSNGNLEKIILNGGANAILWLFTHESNNLVNKKEYREYNIETGEYSLLNSDFDMNFDEFDNLVGYNNFNAFEFDDNYNLISSEEDRLQFINNNNLNYHTSNNPFFLIQNKTFGRKNLFLFYPFFHYRASYFIEDGISQNLLSEFDYDSSNHQITINNTNEGYVTSFTMSNDFEEYYEIFIE